MSYRTPFLFLRRYYTSEGGTLGCLSLVEVARAKSPSFYCYTVEDDIRERKIKHETCIPASSYRLKLRAFGPNIYERYRKRWPLWHKEVFELENVPNYTDILIHCGNTEDHSSGCLIVGAQPSNINQKKLVVSSSRTTYKQLYTRIYNYVKRGDFYIHIQNPVTYRPGDGC